MLAMPSNLLAHHLRVLEQAGIITRRRSEGDHRRTYLQLIPGALDIAGRAACAGRAGGCCSCAPPTRPARTWPQRCGARPAASRRNQPAPIPRRRSPRALSTPPPAIACHCPAAAPPHHRSPAQRRPRHHGLRPGPRGTRRPGGSALIRSRPGPGWRPRQLRRGASRARLPRRARRAAPGGLVSCSLRGARRPGAHIRAAAASSPVTQQPGPGSRAAGQGPGGHPPGRALAIGQPCRYRLQQHLVADAPDPRFPCSGRRDRRSMLGRGLHRHRSGCRPGRCRSPRTLRQARPGPRTCPAWRSSRWSRVPRPRRARPRLP